MRSTHGTPTISPVNHGSHNALYDASMTCPSCGATAPAAARFCPTCGHALVTRPDERRVATALFADLVGFTALSETADPEHVKNLVDRCFERLAEDITTFGGQVDKVIGDALVAMFGAPVAHEDDAERAVRAALRMQQSLADLCAESGMDVRMRIGVNTGEVLVGALRAGGDYTAMGDVVNIASRLQSVAAPGQVVVGPVTHAAAGRGVRFEPLGATAVKGREEPVDAWLAVEATAPPGQRRTGARTPLVGRDTELAVLHATMRTAVTRRRAHLVLVTGEAGVGKTRLAGELGAEAECAHGALVLTGHCIPYGETNVWWPLATMLAQACAVDTDDHGDAAPTRARAAVTRTLELADDDPEIGRIAEGLLYLLGIGGPGENVDPTRAREDALRAALAFFEGLATQRPLVLVLSDLHWADAQLLEFLPRLLLRVTGEPVVLVATTRAELMDRWTPPSGRHNTLHVNLDPLTPEDADVLLAALLPDAPPDLLTALRERSGGNPFFIEELVAMLGDEGPGADRGGELPATLHGLVAARLDRLPPAERAVLEDAAVLGASGPIDLLLAMVALHGADPNGALEHLAEKDLLELRGDEYAFRNELTREVAYGTLTKAERARRHGMLAKHLAEDAEEHGQLDDALDRLAYHFNVAATLMNELGPVPGLPDDLVPRALRFLRRAAARAEQREDWRTATRYLDHALPLVSPTDRAEVLAMRLARARARAELRETTEAHHDLAAVFALAEELGDLTAAAGARTILGDVEFKEGDLLRSAATLEAAVESWRELGDPNGLGDALRFRGMTDVFRGELDGAVRYIDEALTIFRTVGNRRGEAWALQNLAWIAFVSGRSEEAERRLDASAAVFGELGDWGGVSWALGLLAWVRFTQGKLDEAQQLAELILREAGELGNRWAGGIMHVLLANIAVWRGEPTVAIQAAGAARLVFQELADAWGELQSITPLVIAHIALGRVDEAENLLDDLAVVGERIADSAMRALPDLLRAMVAVQVGAPDALELARRAVQGDADHDTFVTSEQQTVLGLAELQAGAVGQALERLVQARANATSRGPDAAASVACAAALVAAGRATEALVVCTETEAHAVTYVDRYRLEVARAFALARTGDLGGADDAIGRAAAIVDATESRLDQLLVRIARSALWGTSSRAEAAAAEALHLADALGVRPVGWERAFALMAGTPG